MGKLTVLLVEDDINTCKNFSEYIEQRDDISLVYTTNNADDAIEKIRFFRPDAVILDLELHNGSRGGLQVLSSIGNTEQKPYILVTTNNSSQTTYECARSLGADYIMYKHQQDYSEKEVVDFLLLIKNVLKRGTATNTACNEESLAEKSKHLDIAIEKCLDSVGIKIKHVGYKFLREAIHILYESPAYPEITFHDICEEVAKNFSVNTASVERSMEYAIDSAWKTTDPEILLENYTARLRKDKASPTVMEFVTYFTNKLKQRH